MFNPFDASINKGNIDHFGNPAYERALAAGYTPDQINRGLQRAQNQHGMGIGENSGFEKPGLRLGNSKLNRGDREVFGEAAVERARSRGYSDEEINSALDASKKVKAGVKASKALGRPNPKSALFDAVVNQA